jgi:predicted signal transduction protein with EAL and GGDEF domain
VQFAGRDLYHTIKAVLAETSLAPHRLELEVTERLLMEESDKTLSTLHRIKQLGVRIAMDDFGTGYSSLSYLRSFPYDRISRPQPVNADNTSPAHPLPSAGPVASAPAQALLRSTPRAGGARPR